MSTDQSFTRAKNTGKDRVRVHPRGILNLFRGGGNWISKERFYEADAWIFPGEKKGGERRSRGLSSIFLLGRREKKGEKSWWRRWKRRRSLLLRKESEKSRGENIYEYIRSFLAPFHSLSSMLLQKLLADNGKRSHRNLHRDYLYGKSKGKRKEENERDECFYSRNLVFVFLQRVRNFLAPFHCHRNRWWLENDCWPTIKICLAAEEIERGKRVILRRHVREPYEFSFVFLSSMLLNYSFDNRDVPLGRSKRSRERKIHGS